jgi:pilus assembly protein CpaB
MTGRTPLRFVGALILGAFATLYDRPLRLFHPERVSSATVPVVVAARDLREGDVIDRSAVTVAQWPAIVRPAAAFSSFDAIGPTVAKSEIFKGEAIVPARLTRSGYPNGFEVRISPGKRAIAIRVDIPAPMSHLIQPGNRVDVVVISRERARDVAQLLLTNLRVLSLGPVEGGTTDGTPVEATVAALEVTSDEAEVLLEAMGQGRLQFLLRGRGTPPVRAAALRPARESRP